MPRFTEDSLQRIIINPFYAITVAPQLTREHEPPMGEAEWVGQCLHDGGDGRRALALVTAGRAGGQGRRSRGADQSFPGRQHRPTVRRRASLTHRTGNVGRRQRHADAQHGGRGLARATAGCAGRRHRDGG